MTADISLIKLDMTLEHCEFLGRAHKLANLLTHAPRRLIGHAKRALQLFARYAMAGDYEKIDRIEPRLKRRATILKDRACTWINMIATKGASESPASRDLVERRLVVARPADVPQAITNFHKAPQASIIIRELRIELANRKWLHIADFAPGAARHGNLLCPLPCTIL
jgi:hypothetical protein